ncbi:MAG: peptide deformylase, partial [Nitrospirae bacterium]|nr:peptide deformylase [Nitrospirota bacterium]
MKKKAALVNGIDKSLQRLIDNMIETMYAARGIGLAAPQVGVSKRLIIVDVSGQEENRSLVVLINPIIVETHNLI